MTRGLLKLTTTRVLAMRDSLWITCSDSTCSRRQQVWLKQQKVAQTCSIVWRVPTGERLCLRCVLACAQCLLLY